MILKIINYFLLVNLVFSYGIEFDLNDSFQPLENLDNNIDSDFNSNAIYELSNDYFESQDTIWVRTGSGLSFITFSDGQMPIFNSFKNENLPEGGSPSYIIKENLIAISGAKSIYQLSLIHI